MLRKIKIANRLMLAFGLMCLLTILVSAIAIYRFNNMEDNLNNIAERRLPSALITGEMNREFLLIRLNTLSMIYAEDSEHYRSLKKRMQQAQRNYDDAADRVAEFHKTEKGSATLSTVTSAKQYYDEQHQQLFAMLEDGNFDKAKEFQRLRFADASSQVTEALSALARYQETTGGNAAVRAREGATLAISNMILITIFAIVAAIILAWLFGRSLIQPIQNALSVSRRIAAGDLSQAFHDDAPDEAGEMIRAMAEMQSQLQATINDINTSSLKLASMSEQLSNVTQQSTRTLNQQSNELEMAATAVNELTTAVEEVAQNAAATSQNSEQADSKAKHGLERVDHTIDTVEKLAGELQQTRERIDKLADRVGEISTVLDVIRAIAEQTNLLALNAAIEAARAGESGRGFAVVADEVRALAHRTQESTKEIERMMHLVQGETKESVAAMTSSSGRASDTLIIAKEAGDAIGLITEAISQISGQNLVIASAAEEQATVAREVDKNLVNIRDLAQETATGASETQTSSSELAKLADHLSQLVTRFKL
ncbi:methyl-accepting chemotaxis protein [Alteromonas gilva]|uniref:Methyl-accepting chemotaxis protein n=1 Tax=Alteromonas gilva TaxID=2987522 RepID=A0ABT5L289_9ALTE|nr:methyl-accepting chemotaxis protein [Alteromonas gilva]MDC8830987.1 methyl-accepting chemotaxis protein [Alteromonas gilva]